MSANEQLLECFGKVLAEQGIYCRLEHSALVGSEPYPVLVRAEGYSLNVRIGYGPANGRQHYVKTAVQLARAGAFCDTGGTFCQTEAAAPEYRRTFVFIYDPTPDVLEAWAEQLLRIMHGFRGFIYEGKPIAYLPDQPLRYNDNPEFLGRLARRNMQRMKRFLIQEDLPATERDNMLGCALPEGSVFTIQPNVNGQFLLVSSQRIDVPDHKLALAAAFQALLNTRIEPFYVDTHLEEGWLRLCLTLDYAGGTPIASEKMTLLREFSETTERLKELYNTLFREETDVRALWQSIYNSGLK